MVVLGTVKSAVVISGFVAVLGSTMLGAVGLRIAIGIRAAIVATAAVFDLRFLYLLLSSNLYHCSFTLCSFFPSQPLISK